MWGFVWVAVGAMAGPPLIVGGAPAAEGSWPDAVALLQGDNLHCTGVLVAHDLVVTAAHCAESVDAAVLGSVVVNGAPTVEIAASYVHDDPTTTLDIAALVLAVPTSVEPRTLAVDCAVPGYADGVTAVVAGFGATDIHGGPTAGELREAEVPVDDADCSDLDRGCNAAVSPGGELIAGGGGVDTCVGDSGGPLYLEHAGSWLLGGTTSRAAWPSSSLCGDGGIYVRADAAIDWLELTTGREMTRPDCGDWNHPPRPTVEGGDEAHAGVILQLSVLANDPDPEDTHQWSILVDPIAGSVALGDEGRLTYLADLDASGRDTFTVEVVDDRGLAEAVEVELTVRGAPWPPDTPAAGAGCGLGGVTGWWWMVLPLAIRRGHAGPRTRG